MTLILGIESTAHTFGIGIVKEKNKKINIISNEKDVFKPPTGYGIEPTVCAKHHKEVSNDILEKSLEKAGISLNEVDGIAYSCGPGLPPCLRAGLDLAKELSKKYKKPLVPVNHCIAHIEIAKFLGNLKDPIILYVSGGNTQIIGYAEKRYRVFGETLDVGIGNAFDSFAREIGLDFPGGPKVDELWKKASKRNNYIELPYVVKGMDLSFSGILSAASRIWRDSNKSQELKEDLSFSLVETLFAMVTEVTERALSHTKKKELILTGGVAASENLRRMLEIMCNSRKTKFYPCDRQYSGDNGAMIAFNGLQVFNSRKNIIKNPIKADFNSVWRTDEVNVTWI